MAFQSSAQVLMSALQPKNPLKPTLAVGSSTPEVDAKSSLMKSRSEMPQTSPTNVIELSRALKELLVISPQRNLLVNNNSLQTECMVGRKCVTTTAGNSTKSCPMIQKENKIKLSRQSTKSRSNSEDADFYAGSAILNSPSPNAIPLPDFDEICDFFTAENRLNCVGNGRVNLVR